MYCIAELVKAVMLLSCTENHFPYIQLLILYNKYKALKNTVVDILESLLQLQDKIDAVSGLNLCWILAKAD